MKTSRKQLLAITLVALLSIAAISASSNAADNLHATKIVIEKSQHKMLLMDGKTVLRTYTVALGRGGAGPKVREGDEKTPEGLYRISGRKRESGYHYALIISYPAAKDIAAARKLGVKPGGDIMIHGIRNGLGWLGGAHRMLDWTAGCIAVTDSEIDEIARAVPDGTPVEIRP
ncbi:MAG TPA: L,D-transpeptidase family protein [Patescibacteria group bacterium]|nr:L,D-transpeptidase family protein [Patescibacteria group bacterium]